MKKILLLLTLIYSVSLLQAQDEGYLLTNPRVQFECTEAVDSLYNFNFVVAEKQFTWLKQQYPDHPLGYFLLALSEYWKILPDEDVKTYDKNFFNYLDIAIDKAKVMYKADKKNLEATFFLAASYGFKARRMADNNNYGRAGVASKACLNYLNEQREQHQSYGAEFLFGDALYDYFRDWLPKHKKTLKPVVMFFPKGDKERGIRNLEKVSKEAFYTRIEAMKFLVDIYSSYEKKEDRDYTKAITIAKFLHETYPNNAYFAVNYAQLNYMLNKFEKAESISLEIMEKVGNKKMGYTGESGRISSFFIADIYRRRAKIDLSELYYKKVIAYSYHLKKEDKGYFHSSLYYMAKYAEERNDIGEARFLFDELMKFKSRKSKQWKYAKKYYKTNRKTKKIRPVWYTYK